MTEDLRPPPPEPPSARERLVEIERRLNAVFRAHPSGPEEVVKAFLAVGNLRDMAFLVGELKRAWVALDLLEGRAGQRPDPYDFSALPPPQPPRQLQPSQPVAVPRPVSRVAPTPPPPRLPPQRVSPEILELARKAEALAAQVRHITGHIQVDEQQLTEDVGVPDLFGNMGPDVD